MTEHLRTSRTLAMARVVCAVWIDYVPPSIQHRPYLLRVQGRGCAGVVLEGMRAILGSRVSYELICPPDCPLDEITAEANRSEAGVFVSRRKSASARLAEFVEARADVDVVLFVAANAVLINGAVTARLLALHLDAQAGATIVSGLPPGMAPVLVISPAAAKRVRTGEAAMISELADALPRFWAQSMEGGAPLLQVRAEDLDMTNLETLPASLLVEDEPTRLAAEQALAEFPNGDSLAAESFKRVRIAFDEQPRPAVRLLQAARGPHTILFSSVRTPFSGAEESLFSLIANLDRSEFRPVAVFPFPTLLSHKLRDAGVSIEIAGWDYTPLSRANLRYCDMLLDEYRPAVVHIDLMPNSSLMVSAHARGIRTVGHLRTLTGPNLPALTTLADRIITVSEAVARDARRNNIDPRQFVMIHNGVDIDAISVPALDSRVLRREKGIAADAFVITSVGIAPMKRVDVLVKAMPKIISAVPTAHFVLVGETYSRDSEHHDALRNAIAGLGLESRVTWWGFEHHIGRVYAISDLLVHCNGHEALARCMIEALAFGLPLVGPNAGGSPEIIESGTTGFLYTPDCPGELADAVIHIASEASLRDHMRTACLDKVQEFTIRNQVHRVQQLYRSLLPTAA